MAVVATVVAAGTVVVLEGEILVVTAHHVGQKVRKHPVSPLTIPLPREAVTETLVETGMMSLLIRPLTLPLVLHRVTHPRMIIRRRKRRRRRRRKKKDRKLPESIKLTPLFDAGGYEQWMINTVTTLKRACGRRDDKVVKWSKEVKTKTLEELKDSGSRFEDLDVLLTDSIKESASRVPLLSSKIRSHILVEGRDHDRVSHWP